MGENVRSLNHLKTVLAVKMFRGKCKRVKCKKYYSIGKM